MSLREGSGRGNEEEDSHLRVCAEWGAKLGKEKMRSERTRGRTSSLGLKNGGGNVYGC